MKTITYFICAIALFFAGNASAQQISTAELQVNGLTCSMCSQATEKSLKTLGFVETITPDLNTNTFMIKFKKDKAVNVDLIKQKVQAAGFSVGNLITTFNFNNVKLDANGQGQVGSSVINVLNAKSQVLNGNVKATIVDKNFIPANAFKKKAAQFKSESYASGFGIVNGVKTRIIHITI
ncbi:MAG: heavy-metal-associated domain-containing protein [Pedobacter sp.]|nr:MAG: heavy-metal-associated domain-containing protein [Pedobacter sp.]